MKHRITVFFLLFVTTIFSQTITVIDAETGKPVEAVAVFNKSKSTSAVSDELGKIDISDFKKNELLTFTHVSYAQYQEKKSVIKRNNYHVYLSKNSEQLDEVVVSVFKNREKTNRIAEQIAVVSSKEIEKLSPQTSADLLASVPGIKVQKSQFGGGSPVLRGMESNRVLLVVDGVRMNNAIYRKGHLQNSITVAPNLLDRTEVVFGPSSVIYGSDALGGVIHYYTKTPKLSEKGSEIKGNTFLRYSSANNEVTNVVSAELRFKKWASFTSVAHSNFGDLKMGEKRSHGFDDWGKVPFYSNNTNTFYSDRPVANSDQNLQRNTGYSQTDVLQKFYVPFSKNTDFKLNIQYSTSSDIPRFDKLNELKNGSLKFAEWYYGPQERLLISPQLIINPKKKWMDNGTITLAYQNIKESRIQRKFGSLDRSYRKESVDAFSLNGDFTIPLAENRNLGYGIEVTYNDVESNSYGKTLRVNDNNIIGFDGDFTVQSRYPDGGSSYLSSAFYVDYRQDINSKSTLNTGIRGTNTVLKAKWLDETFIDIPQNDIQLDNQSLTATIGYVYKPNKTWQLNTVLSSGFRSPNIDDVGKIREKNGKVTIPNTSLKPEHAYNAEIGAQKYFNNRKFRVGANVYYTLLNNYIYRESFELNGSSTIEYDGEDGAIVANVNKGTAYVTGATVSYQGKLHRNWNTSGFVTYTYGKTYDTNEPMSSIPPLFGRFDLSYVNNKFEGGANLVFNSKKDISDYNITEGIDNHEQTPIVNANATEDIDKYYGSPSWMTVGLYGKFQFTKNIALQAQLSNLFDEHYKEFASGVSAAGRNISVSLLTNF
ncbi:TonB-dependent receptor [Tenacibaculum discolor]|uniref:TonB-dependent receptor n=1 Tax=Tenacibaculum discolor TaxID=361581 RepID=A0A2G1BV52_9FLAO|nr:TonB-dependent receptor [Tenacibaculum discolor]MDP2539910.1 TonB-dependent receptor [Tenacibaculum discolor]PHN97878.1 TonB-dependent receptor [Tenacibaculum discolor]PHN99684.1 TonB-dependent receptor [Rhodobacteraceae bacterium 4F10]